MDNTLSITDQAENRFILPSVFERSFSGDIALEPVRSTNGWTDL